MEQVTAILTALSGALVVPLVNYLKAKFIPDELAFVTWAMSFGLCFALAMGINAVVGAGLTLQDIFNVCLTILAVGGAVHASGKQKSKTESIKG